MLNVVERPDIGNMFGQGVGAGVNTLVQKKLEQMNRTKGFMGMGVPREEAARVSRLPEDMQRVYLSNYLKDRQDAPWMDVLGRGKQPGAIVEPSGINPGAIGGSDPLAQSQQAPFGGALSQNMAQPSTMAQPSAMAQLPGQQNAMQMLQGDQGGQGGQGTSWPKQDVYVRKEFTDNSLLDLATSPGMASNARVQLLKAHDKRKKDFEDREENRFNSAVKERRTAHEESKGYYDENILRARAAKDTMRQMDKVYELLRDGKFNDKNIYSALNTFDKGISGAVNLRINTDFLKTADARELERQLGSIVEGRATTFGSRLSGGALRAFMRSLPNLTQTREGNLLAADSLRALAEADMVREQVGAELTKANGGYRPMNFEAQVEEMASPRLDELAIKFNENQAKIKAEVRAKGKPEYENLHELAQSDEASQYLKDMAGGAGLYMQDMAGGVGSYAKDMAGGAGLYMQDLLGAGGKMLGAGQDWLGDRTPERYASKGAQALKSLAGTGLKSIKQGSDWLKELDGPGPYPLQDLKGRAAKESFGELLGRGAKAVTSKIKEVLASAKKARAKGQLKEARQYEKLAEEIRRKESAFKRGR